MLTIKVPSCPEGWDEEKQEFVPPKEQVLQLEHSLVSLSKWESKWCKPFLSRKDTTPEEMIDYVRCMTLTKNVDPSVYQHLTKANIEQINQYINAPMTATTVSNSKHGRPNREVITSELVYYWMISLNIPFECQKWHLNRLLTLVQVCNIKGQPTKKMSRRDVMSQNAALNAARRKQHNTKG